MQKHQTTGSSSPFGHAPLLETEDDIIDLVEVITPGNLARFPAGEDDCSEASTTGESFGQSAYADTVLLEKSDSPDAALFRDAQRHGSPEQTAFSPANDYEALAVADGAVRERIFSEGSAAGDARAGEEANGSRLEEVDLDELDALLDDMLAETDGPAEALPPDGDMGGIVPDLAPMRSLLSNQAEELAGQALRLEQLARTVDSQQRTIRLLELQLDALRGNMDKSAAAAAAKVVREELDALLRSEP